MCRKLYMPARDPRKSHSDEEKYTVCNIEKYHYLKKKSLCTGCTDSHLPSQGLEG